MADIYDELLNDLDIRPPVRTVFGEGEKLVEHFGRNSFDLVYSANAIDHMREPMKVLVEMFKAVKLGHYVRFYVFENEGRLSGYEGMHQWNFMILDGSLLVESKEGREATVTRWVESARIALQVPEHLPVYEMPEGEHLHLDVEEELRAMKGGDKVTVAVAPDTA